MFGEKIGCLIKKFGQLTNLRNTHTILHTQEHMLIQSKPFEELTMNECGYVCLLPHAKIWHWLIVLFHKQLYCEQTKSVPHTNVYINMPDKQRQYEDCMVSVAVGKIFCQEKY